MNVEYIRNSFDTGYVSNEKGEIYRREYSNNIEEILKLENKIEMLEDELKQTNDKLQDLGNLKQHKKQTLFKSFLFASFPFLIQIYGEPILYYLGITNTVEAINLCISIFVGIGVLPAIIRLIKEYNDKKKNNNLLNNKQEFLIKSIEESKNKLDTLNKEKEVNYKEKNHIIIASKIKLEPRKELENLKQKLKLVEDYIKNQNKYKKLSTKKELDLYLLEHKGYSKEEQEFVNDLIVTDMFKRTRTLN